MQAQQTQQVGRGPVAYVVAFGLVLGVVVAAAFGIQLTRIILMNPMLTVASVGGILVLAGVVGAALLGAIDGWADAASAYGRSLGAGRAANIEMARDVADVRAINAKASEAAMRGIPMFVPPPNGNGHAPAVNADYLGADEWTG